MILCCQASVDAIHAIESQIRRETGLNLVAADDNIQGALLNYLQS